jgi:hypothetical protein
MPSREELDRLWENPENWHGIGCYACRADPRVIVPKRVKWAGWTVNFAHRLAWPAIALSVVIALGPLLLLLAFGVPTLAQALVAVAISIALLCALSTWESGRTR